MHLGSILEPKYTFPCNRNRPRCIGTVPERKSKMLEIIEKSIYDEDSQTLLGELNSILTVITGDDGTVNFSPQDVENDDSAFLVAYLDGNPTGCGAIRKISDDTAEVKRIYARKNTAGVGREIISALEEKAKKLGYKKLLLETRVQNTHAIEFYNSVGYTHCEAFGKYVGKPNSYCFTKDI